MHKFFQKDFPNDPIHLFSAEHLCTLLIIVLLAVCLFIFRRFLAVNRRIRIFCYSLAALLIISDISYHVWAIFYDVWSLRESLPLELSDLAVLLTIVMLLTRSVSLFQFLYFAGIGSSIQAMLTPDLGIYSFPHFRFFEFYVSHGGVFLACLFMVAVEKYRPTFFSLWMTLIIVNVYGACVFFINRILNSNYLYIMKKPESASILDFLGPWPWYLLSVEGVMIISFLLLYSPFWFREKIRREGRK
ncbi:TIGR02206 family membrane protein [Bacillus gobiensis]|uniref:YwaF family protein n=1 Tax=Bacillus gobiensis TaxID=1441095 RepID=UPI003D198FDA